MSEINWGILQPVDTGAQVQQGFATGMALVKGQQTKAALANYLQNPDDPQAYSALAYLDPQQAQVAETAHRQLRADQAAQAQLAVRRTAGAQAASGDVQGGMKTALSGGDTEFADALSKLSDDQKKKAADFWSEAGPLAYRLKQISDPAQRQALYEQAKPILLAHGADQSLIDGFDPTNDTQLDAAITTAQKVSDLVDQGKIVWHQQGENPSFATNAMGIPVGSENPARAAPAVPRVTDQKSYDAVPPGGHYLDPEGHLRLKGGQSGASSTGGFQ